MPVLKNPKHERYAQERASGKSQEEAHKIAGYSGSRSAACQLEQRLNISDRINDILAEREKIHGQAIAKAVEKLSITKEWVLATLVDNVQRAMQAEPARDSDGNVVGDYAYQGSVANRGLELIGKELGMFIDRKEVREVDEFDQIDDAEELRRRLAERAKELGERSISSQIADGAGEASPSRRTH